MNLLPDTRESLLIRLANAADHAAWMEFVALYESSMLRYCRSYGLQEDDAREVLQHVLLVVHRRIDQWESSGRVGSFRNWLIRTAHYQCLRGLRRRAKLDQAAGGTSEFQKLQHLIAPNEMSDRDEQQRLDWQRWAFSWAAEHVRRAVQPETWMAFWLSAVEGQSPEEVAARLNMRVGSVYTSKCRVLAKIRDQITQLSTSET